MNTAVFQLIPLTRLLSVTSYIQFQNTLCWWTRISSVSHSCPTAERSRLRILILQAAMLAVSATTHIYVFDCQSLTEDYMRPNAQTAQLLGLRSKEQTAKDV